MVCEDDDLFAELTEQLTRKLDKKKVELAKSQVLQSSPP
jgi:hypothetical protein